MIDFLVEGPSLMLQNFLIDLCSGLFKQFDFFLINDPILHTEKSRFLDRTFTDEFTDLFVFVIGWRLVGGRS